MSCWFLLPASVYKPLLRNSTYYPEGTYMDSEFKDVNMTPLRDDLEYDLDLDCKIPLEKDQTFEVLHMNSEEQMCMYDMSGSAPVDLFEMIRKIIDYLSPAIDIKWIGIINCVR